MNIKDRFVIAKNKGKDEGFVILTALMVIFLIVSIVASVALITVSDLGNNAKQRRAVETRFSGESLADTVFASIAGLESNFLASIVGNPSFGGFILENDFGPWFKILPDGSFVACTNSAEDLAGTCYRAKVERNGTEVILTIIVRSGCRADGTSCTYREIEQKYRVREYIDKVLLTESEQTPGISQRSAYLPGDIVNGAVHTNDPNGFVFCVKGGTSFQFSTDFSNELQRARPTDSEFGRTYCGVAGDQNGVLGILPNQFLAGQVDTTGSETNTASFFQSVATGYQFGSTDIELFADNVRIGGSTRSYPTNGVIYINGDARVSTPGSAVYGRDLTIYATNGISIPGNINRQAGSEALLGLATPGTINIECARGARCPDRSVTAVLKASRILNPNWDDSPAGSVPPYFRLTGSMISTYRPILGSYTSVSDGLENGWLKHFTYDPLVRLNQPPFFFRTTQSNVARSAIDEGPCSYATICT